MAKEERDIAKTLKSRGLSCASLRAMENKQRKDAKSQLNDAARFRAAGFLNLAKNQEAISRSEEKSAMALARLRNKLCGFR